MSAGLLLSAATASPAHAADRSDVDWRALYTFSRCAAAAPCPVVIARRELLPGTFIETSDLALVEVSEGGRWTEDVAHSFAEARGRKVGERILDGEPIRADRLRAPPAPGDPAHMWAVDGMRLLVLTLGEQPLSFDPGINVDVWGEDARGPCRLIQVVPVVGVQDRDNLVRTGAHVRVQTALVLLVTPLQARRLGSLPVGGTPTVTVRWKHDVAFVEAESCHEDLAR